MPTTKTNHTKTTRRATTPATKRPATAAAANLPGPSALARAANTAANAPAAAPLPPLPLALRFPPAMTGDADDADSPEDFADSLANVTKIGASMLPLLLLDGPALLAHLAALSPEARTELSDAAGEFTASARHLADATARLDLRLGDLRVYLNALAGVPFTKAFTPESTIAYLIEHAAASWGEVGGSHDPTRYRDPLGQEQRCIPVSAAPCRVTHDGLAGWAVCLDPRRRDHWGFVPYARATGAPEVAKVGG